MYDNPMIAAIVAMTDDGVIGKSNSLPWYLPADLKRTKQITTGNTIIMGRKTADSIVGRVGHGLPNRKNIVVSRSGGYAHEGFLAVETIEDALRHVEGDAFIFGGEQIYKLAMPYVEKMYVTLVHADIDGDVHFPEYDKNEWQEISRESHKKDDKNQYDYDYVEYERVR